MNSYKLIRNLYYSGILSLILYALPNIDFISKYLYPIFTYEFVGGTQIISLIAILTAIAAFMAYKYRKIG